VQGFQGDVGPAGFGIQGWDGPQGIQGDQGDQGEIGLQGISGTGNQGTQGFQGDAGDIQGPQGVQGLDGNGFQGAQGPQGTPGIGEEGLQGSYGFQGTQGTTGFPGEGGTQGLQGTQGPQGLQGENGGVGNPGLQGLQGTQGFIGIQGDTGEGFQGIQGIQGYTGLQGDYGFQGPIGAGTQGVQGMQGVQGDYGIQGIQGVQGPGTESGVGNLQNIHESSFQDTPMFVPMFEGGGYKRNLFGTTGPNPRGTSNFFYTSDLDELSVENLNIDGNIDVEGTLDVSTISGLTSNIVLPEDVAVSYGSLAQVRSMIESATGNFLWDTDSTLINNLVIERRSDGAALFNFATATGNFTALGDINAASDERLKENIITVENALQKVQQMRGVYYNKKTEPDIKKLGLIAQEVEKVIPEVVLTDETPDKMKSVGYGALVGLLIEAIKELKDELDQIKQ
jgi:hypothetical protein